MLIIDTLKEYNTIINTNNLVFIYAGLTKCPPCNIVYPKFEILDKELEEKNIVFCKILVDKITDLSEKAEIKKLLNLIEYPIFTLIQDKNILVQKKTGDIEEVKQLLTYLDI